MDYRSIPRYRPTAQALHWLTAILVLVAFIFGPGGSEERVYSASRDFDRQLHETLGMTVLVLALLRALWRIIDTPPEPPRAARWMELSARATHIALYVLLFAVPFTAIAGAWLEGHDLTLLGALRIHPWFGESHALGAKIASVHTWLGDTILWVAGVHALAGLYHHLVLRDGVLTSMLPRWISRERLQ
jgi:cytochrome b561